MIRFSNDSIYIEFFKISIIFKGKDKEIIRYSNRSDFIDVTFYKTGDVNITGDNITLTLDSKHYYINEGVELISFIKKEDVEETIGFERGLIQKDLKRQLNKYNRELGYAFANSENSEKDKRMMVTYGYLTDKFIEMIKEVGND